MKIAELRQNVMRVVENATSVTKRTGEKAVFMDRVPDGIPSGVFVNVGSIEREQRTVENTSDLNTATVDIVCFSFVDRLTADTIADEIIEKLDNLSDDYFQYIINKNLYISNYNDDYGDFNVVLSFEFVTWEIKNHG